MLNPQALPFFLPRRPNYYFQTPPPPPQLLNSSPAYYTSPYYTNYVCIHPSPPAAKLPLPPPVVNHHRRQVWLPVCRPRSSTSLEFNLTSKPKGEERRTTVMIRNIPNKIRQAMLLDLLDKHCAEQNKTAAMVAGSLSSEYDFVYLPMDFKNQCNLGYAFVNFTSPVAAQRLYQSLRGYKWDDLIRSPKVAHVCYARIQGKAALVDRFNRSMFPCIPDEFLPVLLSPPRDGSVSVSAPTVLGKRAVVPRNSENLKV